MEQRIGNIIIQAPGGTAGRSSHTFKIALPSVWMQEMGITEEDRQVELSFDGKEIRIVKCFSIDGFLCQGHESGDRIVLLSYFDAEKLCTRIAANYSRKTVCIENYSRDYLQTAFGRMENPTWKDYLEFLESRCISRSRGGLREYLEVLGIESYDPLEIIKKTSGKMSEDQHWMKVEVLS